MMADASKFHRSMGRPGYEAFCLSRKKLSGSWKGPSMTRSRPLGRPSSSVESAKGVREEKSERVIPSDLRSSLNLG